MNLRRLQAFFPEDRHDDIARLYARFEARHGADIFAFVQHLRSEGLVSSETMRDILTLGEIQLSAPPDKVREIDRLVPRHRIVGLLGRGAMGQVFMGRDPDLQRTVAVKRLDPKHAAKAGPPRRFFTEAQITAQLDHPNIVPIYGLETDEAGNLTYAMKLVRGKTFGELLDDVRATYRQGGKPDADHDLTARLHLFLPVCAAIAYAHRRGVIHRDLKPDNIMVGAFHQVLVMDWGIARPIGDRRRVSEGPTGPKTRAGSIIGTPKYMAPEQATGETEGLDERSDLYSLGLILFELVTLRPALEGEAGFETVVKAASGHKAPLVPMFGSRQKVPRELKAIINKATALAPDDRYPSVDALADDIRRFLRDESIEASPDTAVQKVLRWISHHRATTLGIVFALILVFGAVAALISIRGAAALEAQRAEALLRERQLVELTSVTNDQAHKMDSRLRSYEALVTGIAAVAEHALVRPAPESRQYFKEDYVDPAREPPPDLAESKVYQDKISLDWPDFVTAPGVDRAALATRLDQLSSLHDVLYRALLRSHSEEAAGLDGDAARKLVMGKGVPFIWTYAATEDGVLIGMPGLGIYPDDYDPRSRPWYVRAKKTAGPIWGAAEADESGMGLLITCSIGIHGRAHEFLGVAAIDLTFAYVIDELLDPAQLVDVGEAFLIDAGGRVVVRSSQKDSARDFKTYRQLPFEHAEVRRAFEAGPSTGHVEFTDDSGTAQLAIWSHLEAVDWTYLVIGSVDDLLGAAALEGRDTAEAP